MKRVHNLSAMECQSRMDADITKPTEGIQRPRRAVIPGHPKSEGTRDGGRRPFGARAAVSARPLAPEGRGATFSSTRRLMAEKEPRRERVLALSPHR